MRGVVAALVVSALAATALLLAGVLRADPALGRAGLIGLLCVPVVRNIAFAVVEKRTVPRALAIAVGLALAALYVWFLVRGGA